MNATQSKATKADFQGSKAIRAIKTRPHFSKLAKRHKGGK